MQKGSLKNFTGLNMRNSFILFLVILLGVTTSQARLKTYVTKEKVGQKYYLKQCASCHGEGNRGGNLDSIMGWEKSFKDNGVELISLHTDEENTQSVINYLKSEDFTKEKRKLINFLQEFAYDSATIPSCN